MELTRLEERLLAGDYGGTARKLMQITLKVAEVNDARRMLDITSVHGGAVGDYKVGPGSFGTIGIELLEELVATGLKFRVPYTTNVIGMDLCQWQRLGLPDDFARTQMRAVAAFSKLGAIPSYTCIPYLEENVPKFGDHVAWVETGTVVMVNSYIGARSNREVDLTVLVAGITGRTPEYGYHLTENRYGDILVRVAGELDYTDLGALGFHVGKSAATVPVFDGLPPHLSIEEIQQLIGAPSMMRPIALVHIVGVTPEAPTLEAAFGGKKPKAVITVGRKELDEASAALSTAKGRDVDFVSIGCHFCTFGKLRKIAGLLENRRVRDGVTLWIQTSSTVRGLAERDGSLPAIEKAGGVVLCDTCTVVGSTKEHYGFKVMATDSAKNAFVAQATPAAGVEVLYGPLEKCIDAAVSGRW